MKIIHRIVENVDASMLQELRSLGIDANPLDGTRLVVFEIAESDPLWEPVKELAARWGAVDFVFTTFTAAELESAAELVLETTWHHGYPQPEDDFGYLECSYDLTDFCESCEMGKRQTSALRMTREPKWGTRHMLQLNWVFDEFFVRPPVWQQVFQPFGIACEKVLHHRTGKPLETVVQLKFETLASSELDIPSDASAEHCEKCGRTKYHPLTRGKFPRLTAAMNAPIVKSQEYFGSGGSACRAVIVSSEVFQAIKRAKLRGVDFTPLESSEATEGHLG